MRALVSIMIAGVAFWWTFRRGGEEQTVPLEVSPYVVRMNQLNHERKDRQRRRGKTC